VLITKDAAAARVDQERGGRPHGQLSRGGAGRRQPRWRGLVQAGAAGLGLRVQPARAQERLAAAEHAQRERPVQPQAGRVLRAELGERLPAQHLPVRYEVRSEPGHDRAAGRGRHHRQRLYAQRGALGRVGQAPDQDVPLVPRGHRQRVDHVPAGYPGGVAVEQVAAGYPARAQPGRPGQGAARRHPGPALAPPQRAEA
jgi:hypothetical protein